jgi:ABC-type iron transport system FetAB ATPase subunit
MRGFSFWCYERLWQATQHALDESQFWACIERQVRDLKLSSAVLDLNGSEGWLAVIRTRQPVDMVMLQAESTRSLDHLAVAIASSPCNRPSLNPGPTDT